MVCNNPGCTVLTASTVPPSAEATKIARPSPAILNLKYVQFFFFFTNFHFNALFFRNYKVMISYLHTNFCGVKRKGCEIGDASRGSSGEKLRAKGKFFLWASHYY